MKHLKPFIINTFMPLALVRMHFITRTLIINQKLTLAVTLTNEFGLQDPKKHSNNPNLVKSSIYLLLST